MVPVDMLTLEFSFVAFTVDIAVLSLRSRLLRKIRLKSNLEILLQLAIAFTVYDTLNLFFLTVQHFKEDKRLWNKW